MNAARLRRRSKPDWPLWLSYVRIRYQVLFLVLLLTLLALPMAESLGLPGWLIKLPVGACLIAAVMPNATRRTRASLFISVALLVAASLVGQLADVPINSGLFMAVVGFAGLAAAAGTLRFMVMAKKVDSETIYAALSTYLLAGIFFAQLYLAIEAIQPQSIVGPDPLTERNAVYFSFVTLATLGYGDFLPRTDIARGVATFQVIGGQLYLAVMVARLIGLFVPTQPPR